jgi:DNA-binding MurR/RpiR family transcriptional regulator
MTTLKAPPGSVTAAVEARRPTLTVGEQRITTELLELGPDIIFRTVTDVAALANCSISSVVRCCQALGFKGFQDLKIALSRDGAAPATSVNVGVGAGTAPGEVLRTVAAQAADAVVNGTSFIDDDQFARAVQLVSGAARVLVLGVGTSSPLAQDAAYRLATIGIGADHPVDVHVQHVRAGLLGPGDAAICISHTGSTRETVASAQAARAAGAAVLAVTSFAHSPLVEAADTVLVAGSRETAYRVEAMAGRLAHLVVLDALFVAVAHADEARTSRSLEVTQDALNDHRF